MSSYLAEVLSSVEKMEVEHINAKCPEVAETVETCKTEVLTYLENVYVRFIERPRQNKTLANKVNHLQEEISTLITNVEQITRKDVSKAENELAKHRDSLARTILSISFLKTVYELHEALIEIRELRQNETYLECMKKITETKSKISNLNPDEKLEVVDELKISLVTELNDLLCKLSNTFKDNVILKPADNKSVLKVYNENETMSEVLSALYFYNTSIAPLDDVTRFLWEHVFTPVVDYTVEVKTNVENDFATLEIITVNPNQKASYVEVFNNIKTVLEFLLANFHFTLGEDLTTLSYIGRDVRDNLSELIIKRCLQDTVPSTSEGLAQYKVVIEATEELEKSLVMAKIFAEDTASIVDYTKNVDVLFINKKCQGYLMEAQAFMKKDLHDMVEVGQKLSPETAFEASDEFAHCCVSRSVLDLLNLMEKILTQASTTSEACAERLFCTVKNICQKYSVFVPEFHKKLLQTIPQQIALFYNNCMYISFKLTEWDSTHLKKLPADVITLNNLGDEGRQLCEIASDKFTLYVSSQIKTIEEIMKEAGLHKATLEKLEPSTDKSIRQCLRQQELLKTVWHKVLPYTLYNKTLGTILDSLCLVLINSVVKFEDISSDAAEQLLEVFKMVQTRGPKLFTDPKEVSLFVASWYKLNELGFVLGASLKDIDDRWAEGKGPLGLHFKAEELRQLVRALFQNTEKRAALLAKIHD